VRADDWEKWGAEDRAKVVRLLDDWDPDGR